jgi:hypothetical protein
VSSVFSVLKLLPVPVMSRNPKDVNEGKDRQHHTTRSHGAMPTDSTGVQLNKNSF